MSIIAADDDDDDDRGGIWGKGGWERVINK
jgi:hypothetical protein